jgi:L-aminopeptidase/D-esterase-like protein
MRCFILIFFLLFYGFTWGQNLKPRARDFGIPFEGTPGLYIAITDVPGVLVGYKTLIKEAAGIGSWNIQKFSDSKSMIDYSFGLPVVAEPYDGLLNDINGLHVQKEHVWEALEVPGVVLLQKTI